jgi:hypothetical protein
VGDKVGVARDATENVGEAMAERSQRRRRASTDLFEVIEEAMTSVKGTPFARARGISRRSSASRVVAIWEVVDR